LAHARADFDISIDFDGQFFVYSIAEIVLVEFNFLFFNGPKTQISMKTTPILSEKQSYATWIIISIAIILALAPFAIVGDMQDEVAIFGKETLLVSGIIFFIALLFLMVKLEIKIDKWEVKVRFIPFIFKPKVFSWADVEMAGIRKAKPLREFGGWGIRVFPQKRAYTMYGTWGLQLKMKNGKKVFIGTKNCAEFEAYLKNYIFPKYPGIIPINDGVK